MSIGWQTESVSPIGSTTAFGDLRIASLNARVQIDAVYLLATDVTSVVSGTGSTAAAGSLFVCATGANAGSAAEIRSRRFIRYRPGEGILVRCTAEFTPGVANSEQLAGAFNTCDGVGFGYVGEQFGIFRRIAGAVAIHRLTISAGAGGIETLTVTLNGTAFVLPATAGALSTTATATFIAGQFNSFIGWRTTTAKAVDATVTFFQDVPATTVGAFTLTSTGTAVGAFVTVQAGAPNVLTEESGAFVPRTAWNLDRLDGSRGPKNPSGLTIDPSRLNVYETVLPFLGAGAIEYRFMTPQRQIVPVHRIEYPGSHQIPNMRNPSLWIGWQARSLGSTTNLILQGASAAGFVEGEVYGLREPFAVATSVTATTAELVALAIRVRDEFAGSISLREVFPHTCTVANDSTNRTLTVRFRLNPTLAGAFVWTQFNASISAVDHVLAPTAVSASGGREMLALALAGGGSGTARLAEHDIRLGPGDMMVVTVQTNTLTAATNIAPSWHEV